MARLRILLPAAALLMLASAASAQDLVEHSAATSSNATAGTAMRGVGKSAGSLMDKAGKALNLAAGSSSSSSSTVVIPDSSRKQDAPVKFIAPDPALIKPGMDGQELVRRFGEPAMKTSGSEDAHAVETWWYGSGQQEVTVKLLDGKVRSVVPPVRPAPGPAPATAKPDSMVAVLP
jgi:hypothetical protein